MYGIDDATLKQFDEENKACDRFLQQQRARLEQAQAPKPEPEQKYLTRAEVFAMIEDVTDELVDFIGEEVGLLLKGIDEQVRDMIGRITDNEEQLRHLLIERADLRDQKTTFELDSMKECLRDIVTKIELARKGECLPIRRPN